MATADRMLSEYLRQKKPEKEEEQEDEPSKKHRPLDSMYQNPANGFTKPD